MRVIEHEVGKDWNQGSEDLRTAFHLIAVRGAVPSGPAVKDLVAKEIEPIKEKAQDRCGVTVFNRTNHNAACGKEAPFPIFVAGNTILVLPEGVEYVSVLEKLPDGPLKALPDHSVETTFLIERIQPLKEFLEMCALSAAGLTKALLIGIGRIERDPVEDEGGVVVFRLLSTTDPADCAVDPKPHIAWESRAEGALLLLEGVEA